MLGTDSYSQVYQKAFEEILPLQSLSTFVGYSRNLVAVTLPDNTTSFIYRVTVYPKGEADRNQNLLLNALQKVPTDQIPLDTLLPEYAIHDRDKYYIDGFIFVTPEDASYFYSKRDKRWKACKSHLEFKNFCRSNKECLKKQLAFGFRSNNITEGVEIKLEVVAIVDTSMKVTYTYSLLNLTGVGLKFLISLDNKTWQPKTLQLDELQSFACNKSEIFLKIFTTKDSYVAYKLLPQEKYQILVNPESRKFYLQKF